MTEGSGRRPSTVELLLQQVRSYEQSLPTLRVTDHRHTVKLCAPSIVCLSRARSFFDKEPETIRWIAGMPEKAVLFDIGANIGTYTLWAGITRAARVYAFEPEAANFSTLNVNIRLNGLAERCIAYCAGIADRMSLDTLHVSRTDVGQSGHQVGHRLPGSVAQGIVTLTLDHLVYEAGLPCPSHLKIDVDGIEPAILRGGARLLEDERLNSVLIELAVTHPEHRAIISRLQALGFEPDEALLQAVYAKTTGVKHTGNVIFTRP